MRTLYLLIREKSTMKNKQNFFDELMEKYSAAVKESGEKKAEYEKELEDMFNDRSQEDRLLAVIDVNTRRANDSLVDSDETIASGYQKKADEAKLQLDARKERVSYLAFEINRIDSEILQVSKKCCKTVTPLSNPPYTNHGLTLLILQIRHGRTCKLSARKPGLKSQDVIGPGSLFMIMMIPASFTID
jgi:hypothetical protein